MKIDNNQFYRWVFLRHFRMWLINDPNTFQIKANLRLWILWKISFIVSINFISFKLRTTSSLYVIRYVASSEISLLWLYLHFLYLPACRWHGFISSLLDWKLHTGCGRNTCDFILSTSSVCFIIAINVV